MTGLHFTVHSTERLVERGIKPEQVLSVLSLGHVVKSYDGKDVYALERLRVVMARESGAIVTAWRERRQSVKRDIRKARVARKKFERRYR